jgi:beta-galactosidase
MIKLLPDRIAIKAGGEDVSVINVIVVDEKGREVPDASNLIQLRIKGNGKIIGVGNGDPSSHEADKLAEGNWKRHLFNGKCQVIVQSDLVPGQIVLDASSEGIHPASMTINADSSGQR